MTYSHYTNAETLTPHSVEQRRDQWHKPKGLWLSVDGEDDWAEWCRNEGYGDIDGKNRFQVTLADGPLMLTTADEVREFDREFGGPDRYRLAWPKVAERWPGIIIAPYQWELRLSDVDWYYPWDCASGCIWDASVVLSVERVEQAVSA